MRLANWAGPTLIALLMTGMASGAAAAVNEADIGINPTYEQTDANTVVATGGFFAARAFLDSAEDFDGGTLTFPGATSPRPLTPQPDAVLGYFVGASDFSAVNAAFPPGTYRFDVVNSATAATQTVSIDYTMDAQALSIPRLTAASFNALQGLDASTDFSFEFNPFVQNPDADVAAVFLSIFDSTGTLAFSADYLDANTSSIFLAANTLAADQAYRFDLVFDERITGSDGGVPTTIFFDSHTGGNFATAAAVPEPAIWAMMICGFGMTGAALRRRPLPKAAVHV